MPNQGAWNGEDVEDKYPPVRGARYDRCQPVGRRMRLLAGGGRDAGDRCGIDFRIPDLLEVV
jgi:hypothetical protein